MACEEGEPGCGRIAPVQHGGGSNHRVAHPRAPVVGRMGLVYLKLSDVLADQADKSARYTQLHLLWSFREQFPFPGWLPARVDV